MFQYECGKNGPRIGTKAALGTIIGRPDFFEMTRFYFDFQYADGVLRDDTGQELASVTVAHNEAMKMLGRLAKDFSHRSSGGSLSVEVRDVDGPIVRVSATLETTRLRERGCPSSGDQHSDHHFLRDAVRYRRLAARINDPDAAARFIKMAEEYETQVANRKGSQRGR